jgi:tetratricopeptide (TPR) repeat protein
MTRRVWKKGAAANAGLIEMPRPVSLPVFFPHGTQRTLTESPANMARLLLFRLTSFLLAWMLLASARPVWSADVDDLLLQVKKHRKEGVDHEANKRLAEAAKSFNSAIDLDKEAIAAAPTDYRGYLNAAIDYAMLGRFAESADAVEEALVTANSEGAKSTVRWYLDTIKAERTKRSRIVAGKGDAALEAGLVAEAADHFRKAYLIFPDENRLAGLKAASLYIEKLNRPLDAAKLWKEIAQSPAQSEKKEAQEMLQRYAVRIDQASQQALAAPTPESLAALIEAYPDRADLELTLAALHAAARNVSQTIEHLSEAVNKGATLSGILEKQEFRKLLVGSDRDAAFETFLKDSFGSDVVQRMKTVKGTELPLARIEENGNKSGAERNPAGTVVSVPPAAPLKSGAPAPPQLLAGLTVARLTPEMQKLHSLPDDVVTGIIVTEVDAGSRAAEKGFKVNDVIYDVNDGHVSSPEEALERVKKRDDRTIVVYCRGKIKSIRIWDRE